MCRYLQQLGYSFQGRKKTFYVDGHERDDVVKDRVRHCKAYILLELRCYRWVQVSRRGVQSLVDNQAINLLELYHYIDVAGDEKFEFHVDAQMAIQFENVVDCYKVLYPIQDYELHFWS